MSLMKQLDPRDATFLAFVAANPDTPPKALERFRSQVSPNTWRIARALLSPEPPKSRKRRRTGISESVSALREWARFNAQIP
jgi:hypothetical protein